MPTTNAMIMGDAITTPLIQDDWAKRGHGFALPKGMEYESNCGDGYFTYGRDFEGNKAFIEQDYAIKLVAMCLAQQMNDRGWPEHGGWPEPAWSDVFAAFAEALAEGNADDAIEILWEWCEERSTS